MILLAYKAFFQEHPHGCFWFFVERSDQGAEGWTNL